MRLPDGEEREGGFTGDGPMDALFSALNVATGHEARLKEYHVSAVTAGRDALAEVTTLIELEGRLVERPGRVAGHDRGFGPGLPARDLERAPGRQGVGAGRQRLSVQADWRDGERRICFGAGVAERAPQLLDEEGFEPVRAADDGARDRRGAGSSRIRAAAVLHVPPGPVPEAAAPLRAEVEGRDLVGAWAAGG